MPRAKKSNDGRPIESYDHAGKERLNNPPTGLVTPDTDPDAGKKSYAYDPHLDRHHPIRATGEMRTWYTGKPCAHTKKSHINV